MCDATVVVQTVQWRLSFLNSVVIFFIFWTVPNSDNRSVILDFSEMHWCILINPQPEGHGSRFVVHSICLSVCLSIHRTTENSIHQLRYEQAKHIDGLQSDG